MEEDRILIISNVLYYFWKMVTDILHLIEIIQYSDNLF